MSKKINIENKLDQMPSAYQVPDHYFDNFEAKIMVNTKETKIVSIKKYIGKMAIAASVLLMISLGYYQYSSGVKSHTQALDTIHKQNNTIVQNAGFDDLTDDEIIDYLANEDDLEFEVE